MKSSSFDNTLLTTINELLTEIFSEDSVREIYRTMEKVYSLKKEEIPRRIQLFERSLKEIIGTGHSIIEDLLLENLYSKNGLNYVYKKEYELSDYIIELKSIVMKT